MRIPLTGFSLALILFFSLFIMATVSLEESAIMDELAHIPAGYGYVKFLDYRLNPEHPPLVKILAALPLTFFNLEFPSESPAWQADINGQWAVGTQFLYQSGNDAEKILGWVRLGPMMLTLILIAFVYFWARELVGSRWALLPTTLIAFSPTVIAHGHYVTTDIGAALGIVVALYFFIKFLTQPSRKNLLLVGFAFGFAQLLKFSAVILIPYFLLLAVIFYGITTYRKYKEKKIKSLMREAWNSLRSLILIFLIGLLLVYPFYFFTTINYPPERQIRDTDFILNSFAEGPTPAGEVCKPMRCLAELNIWMADKPLIRPLAQYLLGILMVIQRSAGGNTTYFLGEVSASGNPLYFPVVYLMKEPLAILILLLLATLSVSYRAIRIIKRRRFSFTDYSLIHFTEFSMLLFILIYGLYSVLSPLNIGVRHLLPIIPLIYILTAAGLKTWTQSSLWLSRRWKGGIIVLLLLFFLGSVLRAYPHYLPYFNEAIGIDNGWRYVTDSNYDWGQDLKRLRDFVESPPAGGIDRIAVDYFGAGNPPYYLGERAVLWNSAKGDPRESGIHWLAVSVNTLQGAKGKLHPGQSRDPEDEYQWLKDYEHPYARAGKSIFIYKLD